MKERERVNTVEFECHCFKKKVEHHLKGPSSQVQWEVNFRYFLVPALILELGDFQGDFGEVDYFFQICENNSSFFTWLG